MQGPIYVTYKSYVSLAYIQKITQCLCLTTITSYLASTLNWTLLTDTPEYGPALYSHDRRLSTNAAEFSLHKV